MISLLDTNMLLDSMFSTLWDGMHLDSQLKTLPSKKESTQKSQQPKISMCLKSKSNPSVLAMIGTVKLIRLIQNITGGPNGFLPKYLKQGLPMNKTCLSIFVQVAKPDLPTKKSFPMGPVIVVVPRLKKRNSDNGC